MSELEVRIVELEPMQVAAVLGYGESPELEAWSKIKAWGEPRGVFRGSKIPRNFGFNNPNPSPGSPNYGYEIWIPVDSGVEGEGDVKIKDFTGGLYAVTRFKGISNIGEMWKKLVEWCEESEYNIAHHQCLEELHTSPDVEPEEFVFDLYLGIAK